MFPFQRGDELSSQIFSYPRQEDMIHEEDLVIGEASLDDGRNLTNFVGETQLPHKILSPPNNNNNNNNVVSSDEKKKIRKEIERLRRQQMTTLHASLRSLLPLDSIRGKRSMSDHLDAAANYIKHLKRNVQELSVKRDLLRKMSNSSCIDESLDNGSLNWVTVQRCLHGGIEIVMSSGGYGEEGFLLSKVLEAVFEEGFEVTSYVSTKKEEKYYTNLQCKASDDMSCNIDEAGLQQKLNDVIWSSKYNN